MKRYLIGGGLLLVLGCGKDDTPTVPLPGKAVLVFPAKDEACTNGKVVSEAESMIEFSWKAADNTDSYELYIRNLQTADSMMVTATTNKATATLLRSAPYAWRVVSKSSKSKETATSDTWKFYNAGQGSTSYAPFPANITAPLFAQKIGAAAGSVKLQWQGSDADNDIAGYTVCFGTDANPPVYKNDVKDMFLDMVPVSSGQKYYWSVTTKDAAGNTAGSGVYWFTVN
ncbi:hypothetical protein [Chitinophaga varians]|uniref:hypothetical protein n=1 Tax=Chitinophaga varians TaxID=2202339 RepID=UPI00165EEC0A|nr:hypothetical protein [Chitinophaga varians]MBC9914393.1 hypothetical protein [Chitinophaga varians]